MSVEDDADCPLMQQMSATLDSFETINTLLTSIKSSFEAKLDALSRGLLLKESALEERLKKIEDLVVNFIVQPKTMNEKTDELPAKKPKRKRPSRSKPIDALSSIASTSATQTPSKKRILVAESAE